MKCYPLRIPISELPDETTITIPRKAWTLWGTECTVIDIDGDFCRLSFYPDGQQEVRRNQDVTIAMDGVSIDSLRKELLRVYYDDRPEESLGEFLALLSTILTEKPTTHDNPSDT